MLAEKHGQRIMRCYLFNITEIERPNNLPLLLEFYGGDITSIYSDVLVVSAFRSSYVPSFGSVFGRIKEKFGIEFDDHLPEGSHIVSDGLYEFPVDQTSAFNKLWILELKTSPNSEASDSDILRAVHYLENAAGVFDKLGIESISLPLIGAGKQGINLSDSAINIMGVIKSWSFKKY